MKMKRTNSHTNRTAVALALASIFFATVLCLSFVAAPSAHALQSSVTPKERVVDGKVVNKAESAIPGAVVYLRDTRSLNVKTFICDDAGHFHFGQLSQNTDYDLWAESNGVKSNAKSISSFDDKNAYYFTLTVK